MKYILDLDAERGDKRVFAFDEVENIGRKIGIDKMWMESHLFVFTCFFQLS